MTAEGSGVCHRCSAAKGDFLSVGRRNIKTMDSRRRKITRVASGIDLPDILLRASAEKIVTGARMDPHIAQDQCHRIMKTVVRDAVLIFSSTRSG